MKKNILLILMVLLWAPFVSAQSWATLPTDMVISMNTSTPGTTLTSAILNAGSISSDCTIGTQCTFSSPVGMSVGANANVCSNLGPMQMNGTGGALLSAQSLNGNNISHLDSSNGSIGTILAFNSAITSATKMFSFTTCLTLGFPRTANGNDWDMFMAQTQNGDYSDTQFQGQDGCAATPGGFNARLETHNVTPKSPTMCVIPGPQTTYYISDSWDPVSGVTCEWIWTVTGTFISRSCIADSSTVGQGRVIQLRIFSNEGGTNPGTSSLYQNTMLNWSNTAPAGTTTFTNGLTTVNGTGFVTDGSWTNAVMAVGSGTTFTYYTIASVQSATSLTLATTFSGTTGSSAYIVMVPFFWHQTDTWTGVVAPSRGAQWSQAGVTGGIPTNRTQCVSAACNAITSAGTGVTASQIQTAFSGAPSNTFVLLPSGTLSSVTSLTLSSNSNVTLRGAGANQTIIPGPITINGGSLAGGGSLSGGTNGPFAVTGDVLQGSNTISIASSTNLKIGNTIALDQQDSLTDLGGLLILGSDNSYTGPFVAPGNAGPYSDLGETQQARCPGGFNVPASCFHQEQFTIITQCDGVSTLGHACASGANITISPVIVMSNWSTANMFAWWGSAPLSYDGIEDLTADETNSGGSNGITLTSCSNCWVKGVAVLTSNLYHVQANWSSNDTVSNSYFFHTQNESTSSYGVVCNSASKMLIENNIFHAIASPIILNGTCDSSVVGYNYAVNDYFKGAGFAQNTFGSHSGGDDTTILEGNIGNYADADTIHGTANMGTMFRNFFSPTFVCWASGATYATSTYEVCNNARSTVKLLSYHRFYNIIGNVLGLSGTNTTYNPGTVCEGGSTPCVYMIGTGNTSPNDANVLATMEIFANADSATGFGSPRFNCNEVENGVAWYLQATSQAFLFAPCPATHAIPASFYYSAKPAWWPSGKAWPFIGPDVTGGNLLTCAGGTQIIALVTNISQCNGGGATSVAAGGLAFSNPAMDCYLSLGGLPNGTGPVLTNFNESSCYSAGPPQADAPTCDHATGIYNPPQTVTCSDTSSGAIICYTLDGSTPATNGSSGCSAGSLYSSSLVISVTTTLKVIAGGTGFSDSSVTTYVYTMRTTAVNPSCSPGTGTYTSTQTVTCTDSSPSSIMCYTTNGTTPATNGTTGCTTGTLYSGTITVSSTETLKIIGGGSIYFDSSVVTYVYTIKPFAANPSCAPGTGTYVGAQSITCTDSTGGAIMCYTTNGTTPATNGTTGCTVGTLYTIPINVSVSETLKIIAGGTGLTDSAVVSYVYTILALANNPSCFPISGAYSAPLNVNCSDTSSGTVMCYTVDGSTPATNGSTGCASGTLYSITIILSVNTTLNIVAGGTGYADSSVVTYVYTINGVIPVAPTATIFALTQLQKGEVNGKQTVELVQSDWIDLLCRAVPVFYGPVVRADSSSAG